MRPISSDETIDPIAWTLKSGWFKRWKMTGLTTTQLRMPRAEVPTQAARRSRPSTVPRAGTSSRRKRRIAPRKTIEQIAVCDAGTSPEARVEAETWTGEEQGERRG